MLEDWTINVVTVRPHGDFVNKFIRQRVIAIKIAREHANGTGSLGVGPEGNGMLRPCLSSLGPWGL